MKARVEKTEKVVLELTEEEALWLRNAMSNPLMGQTLEQEEIYERNMRRKIFQPIAELEIWR